MNGRKQWPDHSKYDAIALYLIVSCYIQQVIHFVCNNKVGSTFAKTIVAKAQTKPKNQMEWL